MPTIRSRFPTITGPRRRDAAQRPAGLSRRRERRPGRTGFVAVASVVVLVVSLAPRQLGVAAPGQTVGRGTESAADDPRPEPGPDGLPFPVVADPRVDPAITAVPVDGPALRDALARLRATERTRDDARLLADQSDLALAELASADARLVERLVATRRRADKSVRRVDELRRNLRGLAVTNYVTGTAGSVSDPTLSLDDLEAAERRSLLFDAAFDDQLDELTANLAALELARAVIGQTEAELAEVRDRATRTTAIRDQARAQQTAAEGQLVDDLARIADARLEATVVGVDLPFVALDAYVRAARGAAELDPACRVGWPLLAGIGRTESRHGSFGGSLLAADGSVAPPILGIPLDGTRSALIADTDGGALDGDIEFDRAVGPMQFIPGTWARWGRDGNADQIADPHNLYDAARAAADYLCASGDGLDLEPASRNALLSYNRSDEYGRLVLERARGYAEVIEVPAVPTP